MSTARISIIMCSGLLQSYSHRDVEHPEWLMRQSGTIVHDWQSNGYELEFQIFILLM